MNRADDWLKQADKDLIHAKESLKIQHYEWSVLAAQQSAEEDGKGTLLSDRSRSLGKFHFQIFKKIT